MNMDGSVYAFWKIINYVQQFKFFIGGGGYINTTWNVTGIGTCFFSLFTENTIMCLFQMYGSWTFILSSYCLKMDYLQHLGVI